jgi:hypothetical protein
MSSTKPRELFLCKSTFPSPPHKARDCRACSRYKTDLDSSSHTPFASAQNLHLPLPASRHCRRISDPTAGHNVQRNTTRVWRKRPVVSSTSTVAFQPTTNSSMVYSVRTETLYCPFVCCRRWYTPDYLRDPARKYAYRYRSCQTPDDM